LRNKVKKDVKKIGAKESSGFFVECDFVGDIKSVIADFAQDNKTRTFQDYVFEEGGESFLRVKKEFDTEEVSKKIFFWSQKDGYKPIDLDASFQKIFQISNIWAHTNPEDESKFGSATVCGNLLADISEKFKIDHKKQYDDFLEIFNKTFNSDTAGLQRDLNEVASETEKILNEQFGHGKLKFKFDTPEPNILFKNIKILVNDGEETELSDKGHGMQRAVILSLLQVYAKRITQLKDEGGNIKLKPHFLFVDEPEMGLHPQAQKRLFEALRVIATTHQVFISTHSENFISPDQIKNIYKFKKKEEGVEVKSLNNFNLDLKPYRKFFFHHHKLFFTDRAIFVEGPDDIERYPQFCEKEKLFNLKRDFYVLGGSGDFSVFRSLCDELGIKSFFIFDADVLAKNQTTLKNYDTVVWSKIQYLGKEVSKKDPTNLLDDNLTGEEKNKKTEIVDLLKKNDILVLKDGAIEQYLDENANTSEEAKRKELIEIFGYIEAKK
ncbi:MAG: AAA family ATPase, partial [Patescibacteria group bacterium]